MMRMTHTLSLLNFSLVLITSFLPLTHSPLPSTSSNPSPYTRLVSLEHQVVTATPAELMAYMKSHPSVQQFLPLMPAAKIKAEVRNIENLCKPRPRFNNRGACVCARSEE